jgi:hypothetical protein
MLHTLRFSLQNAVYFILLFDCYSVVRLLFVLFCVLFVFKCVLPPGDNPIAVNKYYYYYYYNANFFGFCIIHTLHTGCAKI